MSNTRLTLAGGTLATALLAAAAVGVTAPAQADSAAAKPDYKVSLKASVKVATAKEDQVKLTGKVSPKAPGSKVTLQIRYNDKRQWKSLGTTKVKGDGSYKFVDKPTTHLDRSYRVVKAGSATYDAGVSRDRDVKVYGWDWLTALEPSAEANVEHAFTLPINGETYKQALFGVSTQDNAYAEYTLGRKCLAFDTTFGLSDRTATGGKAIIRASADTTPLYAREFDLGVSEARTFDVTGVYRLRLDFNQVPSTPDTEPAAGAARVLCD
jgi:NPCBM/NEW2 domain